MPFTKQPLTLIKNKVTVEISCNLICCFKMKDTWTQLPVVNSPYSPHFFIFILKEIKVCISGMLYPSLNALVGFYFFFFFFFFYICTWRIESSNITFFCICPGKAAKQKTPPSSASAPFLRSLGSSCFMCFSF